MRYQPLDANRPIRAQNRFGESALTPMRAPDADARLRELERAQAATNMLAIGTGAIMLLLLFVALRERQD